MLMRKDAISSLFFIYNFYRYPFVAAEIFGCEIKDIIELFFVQQLSQPKPVDANHAQVIEDIEIEKVRNIL